MFDEMEVALVEAELGIKKEIKARRTRMLHMCECCVFSPLQSWGMLFEGRVGGVRYK